MSENSGQRCPLASYYHRITGRKNYFFDFDNMGTMEGDISLNMGVSMPDFEPKYFFDYKRQCNALETNTQSVSTKYFAMKGQIAHANRCKVGFFIILTYLSEEYEHKTYYVIPANSYANKFFTDNNWSLNGKYQSLKTFAKFIHALKSNHFNESEEIPLKDRWNEFIKISNKNTFTLGELSSTYALYPLPKIEIL